MKALIMRFLTLFVVVTGFCASIPSSVFAIHFGPIPERDKEAQDIRQEKVESEHPGE